VVVVVCVLVIDMDAEDLNSQIVIDVTAAAVTAATAAKSNDDDYCSSLLVMVVAPCR
jgi:hypothetical protein